ncbi:MAG TPA: MYXO-CTERM sorting domain-containing protein [Anaeromyxobacteraceae bacterium]|nr:MYXO-CTERM sorting domain-containing protein [Anaeromyxobacteraceae bacterium]
MRRRLARLLSLLLLTTGTALGQTSTGSVSASASDQPSLTNMTGRSGCQSSTTTATWNWTSSATPSTGDTYRLAVYSSSSGCSSTVPALGTSNAVLNSDVLATPGVATGSYTPVSVSQMASAGGVTNCDYAYDQTVAMCVYIIYASGTTPALVATGTFNFQLAIPPAPVINSASPETSSISVNVSAGSQTDANHQATSGVTIEVLCYPATTGSSGSLTCPTPGSGTPVTGNPGNITCGGLTNFTPYCIQATGVSQAGNESDVHTTYPYTVTPEPFLSFWQVYKTDGGVENGGCSTGGAGAIAPALVAIGLLGLRRRKS